MESTGSQVFIKEEMEEETKDVLSHIVSQVPVKEEDPLERLILLLKDTTEKYFYVNYCWSSQNYHLNEQLKSVIDATIGIIKGIVSRDWIGPCIVLMDRP